MKKKMLRVLSARPLDGLKVELAFNDGTEKVIDFGQGAWFTNPIFEPVRNDPALFRTVKVYEEFGDGIYWANGADIWVQTLYDETPATEADRQQAIKDIRVMIARARAEDEAADIYRARIQSLDVLDGFEVRLVFDDGTEKALDLAPYIAYPIFEPVRNDPALFRQVEILTAEAGQPGIGLYWNPEAYIMAQTLYDEDVAEQERQQTSLEASRAEEARMRGRRDKKSG